VADVDLIDERRSKDEPGERDESPFRSYGPWFVLKWVLIVAFNGFVLAFIPRLIDEKAWLLLAYLVAVVVIVDLTYAFRERIPGKWLIPGVALLVLFGVFPVIYNVYLSLTNYGTCGTCGLLTRSQAVDQIVGQSIVPVEDGAVYRASVFEGDDGLFLVLQDQSDPSAPYFVGTPDGLEEADPALVTDTGTRITGYDGLTALNAGAINDRSSEIAALQIPGEEEGQVISLQGISSATVVGQQFIEEGGRIVDTLDGTEYEAVDGTFTATDGSDRTLSPSFQVLIGAENYSEIASNDFVREPFVRVFIWTFVFSALTVASTFALGLLLALLFDSPRMRGKSIYRTLMIIPYALPTFMTVLVWRGMLNERFGIINEILPIDVPWLNDAYWAKFSVLLVNLWLGYAFMFLVCTGALASIPTDLKEAAFVDGATGFKAFKRVTFPLLFVAVAPVLISSFAFNFNNFVLIYLLTEGGPAISGSLAGETDIMLSYSFKVAFGGAGANYGLAAAISTVIFVIVAIISLIGFRYTRSFEEVN
jgi:arabinogalactan oligomer / maltooligosaccharide transport system permease protein